MMNKPKWMKNYFFFFRTPACVCVCVLGEEEKSKIIRIHIFLIYFLSIILPFRACLWLDFSKCRFAFWHFWLRNAFAKLFSSINLIVEVWKIHQIFIQYSNRSSIQTMQRGRGSGRELGMKSPTLLALSLAFTFTQNTVFISFFFLLFFWFCFSSQTKFNNIKLTVVQRNVLSFSWSCS